MSSSEPPDDHMPDDELPVFDEGDLDDLELDDQLEAVSDDLPVDDDLEVDDDLLVDEPELDGDVGGPPPLADFVEDPVADEGPSVEPMALPEDDEEETSQPGATTPNFACRRATRRRPTAMLV